MSKEEIFRKTVGFISKVYNLEATLNDHKDDEITKQQLELLKILYFSCRKNISGLSQCLNVNLPNCSREVKKVTELGLIEKITSLEDKIKTELKLTLEGREKVEKYLKSMNKNFFRGNSNWDNEKIERCLSAYAVLEKEIFNY